MTTSLHKKALGIVFTILVILGVLIGAFFALNAFIYEQKQADASANYKDATYVFSGQAVQLTDGYAEESVAPGASGKIITRYFGNSVTYDFNNDGRDDIAFLVTQETGGSGVFYYVVAALNTDRGYIGSEALFLGDRIAPQTTNIDENGFIVVNYADRAIGESFANQPSVGKSMWVRFDAETMQLGEVVKDFEGEASADVMTLSMKTWKWIKTVYDGSDMQEVTPKQAEAFTLTFMSDGNFSATTDCNSIGGTYSTDGERITFGSMISTLMFCEGSQETEFQQELQDIKTYEFTSKGELVLNMQLHEGVMLFK